LKGTVFGDLDWPLNASRGFVSISWAYCWYWVGSWCGSRTVIKEFLPLIQSWSGSLRHNTGSGKTDGQTEC